MQNILKFIKKRPYMAIFLIFIINVIITFLEGSYEIINELKLHSLKEILVVLPFFSLKLLMIAAFQTSIFAIPMLIFLFSEKKAYKNVLNKEDFHKYEDYYRDIIKDYSPLLLGYIDDFKIEQNDIIASILNLQLKNYIMIDENKNIKIINQDFTNLNKEEQYILENINSLNLLTLNNILVNEGVNKDLLKSNLNFKKIILNFAIYLLIALISFILMFYISFNFQDISTTLIIIFVIIIVVILPIYTIFLIAYTINLIKYSYVRTEKGKEINKKLEGLKNFLKDFSILDEREQKEISIWKEYLVYSVLFNQNKNIIADFEKKIRIFNESN